MKQLLARQLTGPDQEAVYGLLEIHRIDSDNWNHGFPADAGFGIGHDTQNIYLRYVVTESNILARYRDFHDPVHEDSCVEFFISFDGDFYYNLEFNCIGTIHAAYGKGRQERIRIENRLLKSIRVNPSLGTNKIQIVDRETRWTLDVLIPLPVFTFTRLDPLNQTSAQCNFYKCGDRQAIPHYLSWNPIFSEKPDFHRPEYFGKIKFV